MTRNTFVSLGDHFEGFIEEQIPEFRIRKFLVPRWL